MNTKQTFVATRKIETDRGEFLACYSRAGLARLDFPAMKGGNAPATEVKDTDANIPVDQWHKIATKAVRQALRGERTVETPPLDLSQATRFQKKVWAALQSIPAGKTETYSSLATLLKKPKAARAVGGACGANPIPLLIPCHRVVAAHGGLGGFSGGLPWKRMLLERESAGN